MINKIIRSNSSTNLIKYIEDGEAHDTSITDQRCLVVGGYNLDRLRKKHFDAMYSSAQFSAVQSKARNKNKKTKAYHLIFSFSEDDFPMPKNKKELKKQAMQAGQLVAGFLGKDLDRNSQWFLGVQRDGKGHMLHVHVALNSVLTTGKVLNTNVLRLLDREKDDVKEKGLRTRINEYLEDNFQDITGRPYKPVEPSNENLVNHKEVHVNDRERAINNPTKAYNWKEHLKSLIYNAFDASDSLSTFETALKENGVSIRKRHARKKDKTFRDAFTYSFTGDDQKLHKIRDFAYTKGGGTRGLGKSFTPDALEEEFEHERIIKKQRIQEQTKSTTADIKQLADSIIAGTSTSDSRTSESGSKQADADESIFAGLDFTGFETASRQFANGDRSTKTVDKLANVRSNGQENGEKENVQLYQVDLQSLKYADKQYFEDIKRASDRRKERERKLKKHELGGTSLNRDADGSVNVDFTRNSESERTETQKSDANILKSRRQQQLDENPFDDNF